jgi:hypothetical protein
MALPRDSPHTSPPNPENNKKQQSTKQITESDKKTANVYWLYTSQTDGKNNDNCTYKAF